ncbi:hypothetical protein K1T71_000635 [Dendrolimus kikuchii]|uniref:Uncharacterized protein n=1 Tax=Dendrolimus kikuchii TaxID=765133 RepID=A0ACC1DKM9_9NEOP|nr:hypothetical protein K1T71_000635 [Dendrolimus kikuchii]
METLSSDADLKELNDSGFGQDESISNNGYKGKGKIQDLCDDVLLIILKYCQVQDLKAFGYTCKRFANLIVDRTLWQKVDARSVPVGVVRMRWMMRHGIYADTTHLYLTGFAKETTEAGCLQNNLWAEELQDLSPEDEGEPGTFVPCHKAKAHRRRGSNFEHDLPDEYKANYSEDHNTAAEGTSSNQTGTSSQALDLRRDLKPTCDKHPQGRCPRPRYTFDPPLLRHIKLLCLNLHTLEMEYCNINCRTELDLSCCRWLEPGSILPISKLSSLKKLYMRRCPRMTEFVAYASLATRYGFNKLELVDLRESPVGDSEVSSFGWVRSLRELYACPPHDDLTEPETPYTEEELEKWEEDEPSIFSNKQVVSPFWLEVGPKALLKRLGITDPLTLKAGYRTRIYPKDENNENDAPPKKRKKPCHCVINANLRRIANNDDQRSRPSTSKGAVLKLKSNNRSVSSLKSEDSVNESNIANNTDNAEPMNVDADGDTSAGSDTKISSDTADGNIQDNKESADSIKENSVHSDGVANVNDNNMESTENDEASDDVDAGTSKQNCINNNNNLSNNQSDTHDNSVAINDNDTNIGSDNVSSQNNSDNKEFTKNIETVKRDVNVSSSDNTKTIDNCQSLGVNVGAGTSKQNGNDDPSVVNDKKLDKSASNNESHSEVNTASPLKDVKTDKKEESNSTSNVVRFVRNNNALYCDDVPGSSNAGGSSCQTCPIIICPPINESVDRMPQNNILYVNISRRLNNTYRLTIPADVFSSQGQRAVCCTPGSLDSSNYVTDYTVYRFGRSDNEQNLNYVQIGPNIPPNQIFSGMRPNQSNLRVLSLTGYRNITNRSLLHLASAAPHLRLLDLRRTRVTQDGVEKFKSRKPECEVIWSEFIED